MSDQNKIIVTVAGDRSIHQVATDLRQAGMDVDQVLEFTGTVTGSAPAGAAEGLRRISGVADVSVDHAVDIGPPDSLVS